MPDNKLVKIYTDGACKGNPGPGGWAALLRYGGIEKVLSGAELATTNNRMEMQAAISGIGLLTKACKVAVYTDSKYVKDGITKWIHNWKKNNWSKSDKGVVKNVDLWKELDLLTEKHQVEWHWVKGHSGHPENELVDAKAKEAMDNLLAKA
jgi:ribonuclease HI